MNGSLAFDSLAYFEKLKGAGMTEAQAKVQVEAIQDVVASYDASLRKDLATKTDIESVKLEIQTLRSETQITIANTKHDLLKWMVGLAVGQLAFIVALIAFVVK